MTSRPLHRRPVWPLLLILLSAACSSGQVAPGAAIVRDSAGVRIVENQIYAWDDSPGWRIAPTPEVDIGVLEGDARYQLFRVVAATRLSDGRIAIANSGTHEVRIFDAEGRHLASTGREGEGPGEFSSLSSIFPFRGDSILAWDERLQRVSVLTDDGALGRVARVEGQAMNPRLLRPFADGSFLRLDEHFELAGGGTKQQIMVPTLHDAGGALVDSLGELPFTKTVVIGSGSDMQVGLPGFSPHTTVAVDENRYIVGRGSETEVEIRSPAGTLVGIIRWPDHDRNVTEADIAANRAARLHGIEDENRLRARRAYYEAIPYEQEFPAYRQIVADRSENLWIERYSRPGEEGPPKWLVIDAQGMALGEIELPEGLRVLELGDDYVLGVQIDDFDVEHVRLYRLLKESTADEP